MEPFGRYFLSTGRHAWNAVSPEKRPKNPAEPNPLGAKAKAASFKSEATEDAIKAKVLEHNAKVAETKAKAFLAKTKSAEAKA